jgi:hypothetical protein
MTKEELDLLKLSPVSCHKRKSDATKLADYSHKSAWLRAGNTR